MTPFWRVALIIAGIILLLPGICTLWFIGSEAVWFVRTGSRLFSNDPAFVALWLACLAVSAGGVVLIRRVSGRR